ncbi:MAG: PRC-barrel domain-containing protein [Alphaproteobacteria bacterium]
MIYRKTFGPVLGIAIMTAASGAFAAGEEPVTSDNVTNSTSATSAGAVTNDEAATNAETDALATGETGSRHMLPPEAVIGKDVTNSTGDNIGTVSEIAGDQVIVSVGGFLGLGAHDVALDWSQFTTSGEGDDIELHTKLSKDQLESMPEYKS